MSYLFRRVLGYFVARTLWDATHQRHRLPDVQSYKWQEGDQIVLVGRGHFVNRGGRWIPAVEP